MLGWTNNYLAIVLTIAAVIGLSVAHPALAQDKKPNIFAPLNAVAQQPHLTDAGFSFAVYGDSRSMFYLPYRSDQEAEARQLMVQMFELVFPANIAKEVVKRDVKLIYDPATHELA